jgi:hypothetical protein
LQQLLQIQQGSTLDKVFFMVIYKLCTMIWFTCTG